MQKRILLFSLLAVAPFGHAASIFFSSHMKGASSSSETADVPMHTFICAEGKEISIPEKLAIKYSGLLEDIHGAERELSGMKGFEGLKNMRTDLSTAGISCSAVSILAELMRQTYHFEEESLFLNFLKSSTLERSKLLAKIMPLDIDEITALLKAADFLRIKPIITDVIAYICIDNFAEFFDYSSGVVASSMAKVLYLTLPEDQIPAHARNGVNGISFGVSIQDLIDHKKIPEKEYFMDLIIFPGYTFDSKNIDDLSGLQNIPGIQEATVIVFTHNPLQTIKAGAFKGLTKLMTLVLDNNHISNIYPGAFEGIGHNLVGIQLRNNLITDPAERARITAEVEAKYPKTKVIFD